VIIYTRCRAHRKRSYATVGDARRALAAFRAAKRGYPGEVYHCGYCLGYHIGRPPQRAHRNRYRTALGKDRGRRRR
jgi:hypothetical protein